jgi:hypothetical protein
MLPAKDIWKLPSRLPIVLPSIHVALAVITLVSGEGTASGGNPLFCMELPISLPLVARDDTATVITVAVVATVWWYFIVQIARSTWQGKTSRAGSGLGALLMFAVCAVDSLLMGSEFFLISREPNFSWVDSAIYIVAVALLSGGLISATCSALVATGFHKH